MTKQNPFSVYDFLGYLIPGSILIYSYLVIDFIKVNDKIRAKDLLDNFSESNFESIFFFIIVSYTLGHFISFLSSITIEKYANWVYSYPSKYLLDMKYKSFWKSARDWQDRLWRILIIPTLLPCVIFDMILGQGLGFKKFYTSSIDPLLQNIILDKLNSLLIKLGHVKNHEFREGKGYANNFDFHRIATHYAYENSKNHQSKLSNYVALYGFLRTLCFIFNLLSIYFFYRMTFYIGFTIENLKVFLTLCSLTYISFMAFMKFYRRYTLEGLMVIAIDEKL